MFVGKVIGTVWSTVKWPEMTGQKLLLVRPYHLRDLRARSAHSEASQGAQHGDRPHPASAAPEVPADAPEAIEAVVCVDLLDAGVGDDVVVAFGHAARVAAEQAQNEGRSGIGEASSGAQSALGSPPKHAKTTSKTTSTTTPIDAAVVAVVDSFHVA